MKKAIESYRKAITATSPEEPVVDWLLDSKNVLSRTAVDPETVSVERVAERESRLLEVFSQVLLFLGEMDTQLEDHLTREKKKSFP